MLTNDAQTETKATNIVKELPPLNVVMDEYTAMAEAANGLRIQTSK